MIYSRLRDLCYETWPKLSKNRRRPENAPGCTFVREFLDAVHFENNFPYAVQTTDDKAENHN